MAEVKFLIGTQSEYNSLDVKDNDALYFLTDSLKIMKGESDFTSSVLFVSSLPGSGQLQGKLYINTTNGTGSIWNGASWTTVLSKTNVVNNLTSTSTTDALSAAQGKALNDSLTSHKASLAGASAGHVKTGGDVEISDGLITVKKVDGQDWSTIQQEINKKANLAGATFTGAVSVPTPTTDGHAATKKYVDDNDATTLQSAKDYADSILSANDAMVFKGTLGTGGTVTALPATHETGWTYRVVTAGNYAGISCEIGDLVICITDGSSANNAHWTVAQTNIDGAVVGPASATDATVVLFNGTSGKQIKGSTITLTQLQNAVTNAHTHSNKANLDTYTKDMDDLKTEIEESANSYTDTQIEQSKSGLQDVIDALKMTDLADTDLAAVTDGQVIYWDATASKWKAKTVATVDISGKMDKLTGSTNNHVVLADGTGNVKDSGKTIGNATLASSPNANTIATEAAVKAYADSIQTVWESIA